MRKLGIFLFFCFPCFLFAQQYTEMSGQTVVFNLSAGAKASWNSAAAKVISPAIASPLRKAFALTSRDGKSVTYGFDNSNASVNMVVYSLAGARLKTVALAAPFGSVNLNLANGYYLLRLERPAAPVFCTPLLITR
ncbi:MAG: T9SS type A sorting domain-containing protein [Chitinivibrionales bacterium]|nr:T9SS type A sorting domain-containing protein [Chitinivibrionales bacterium]